MPCALCFGWGTASRPRSHRRFKYSTAGNRFGETGPRLESHADRLGRLNKRYPWEPERIWTKGRKACCHTTSQLPGTQRGNRGNQCFPPFFKFKHIARQVKGPEMRGDRSSRRTTHPGGVTGSRVTSPQTPISLPSTTTIPTTPSISLP